MGNPQNIMGKGRRFSADYQPAKRGRKPVFKTLISIAAQADNALLTKNQIMDIYTAALSLPEKTLKEVVNNPDARMIERIIAKEVLGKKGFDTIEKIVNRIVGMPRQATDITSNGKEIAVQRQLVIEVIDTKEQVETPKSELMEDTNVNGTTDSNTNNEDTSSSDIS